MIRNGAAPFRSLFLVFPFKNLLDAEIPGFAFPGVKTNNPKTTAADITQGVSRFQGFLFCQFRHNTVKMNRFSGQPVRQRRGDICDNAAATAAVQDGQGIGILLGSNPAGPFMEGTVLVVTRDILFPLPEIALIFVFLGIPGISPVPSILSKGAPAPIFSVQLSLSLPWKYRRFHR